MGADAVVLTTGGDGGGGRGDLIGVERGYCQAYELDDITSQIRH